MDKVMTDSWSLHCFRFWCVCFCPCVMHLCRERHLRCRKCGDVMCVMHLNFEQSEVRRVLILRGPVMWYLCGYNSCILVEHGGAWFVGLQYRYCTRQALVICFLHPAVVQIFCLRQSDTRTVKFVTVRKADLGSVASALAFDVVKCWMWFLPCGAMLAVVFSSLHPPFASCSARIVSIK